MGRGARRSAALSQEAREQLEKLAEGHVSDAELLEALWHLAPRAGRSPAGLAELLHNEFDVPLEAARAWCIDDALGAGTRMGELADRCWRWIHRRFRGVWPAHRVSRLTPEHEARLAARAAEIDRLVTTPAPRPRESFERAVLEAYRLADLPTPRVLWVDGPAAGMLMVFLCLYHGPQRQRLAQLLSERRFARPPLESLGPVLDSLSASLRDFMPAAYAANLPRYLSFDTVGVDVSGRIVGDLLERAVQRLDPVRSTRVSHGVLATLKAALGTRGEAETAAVSDGLWSALQRAFADGEFDMSDDFAGRGVWWRSLLGPAAVAVTAAEFGADPVYPLARLHRLAWALARGGCWSWLGSKVAVCADGPTSLGFNDNGLLHSEHGAAVAFRDGFDVYAFEGHVVPDWVVKHPESITLDAIDVERSAEVRRVMIDVYGRGRYLTETGAQVLHMDMVDVVAGDPSFGCMPRALMRDKEGRRWLVGTDGSTHRVYYMRVPDLVRTCADAHSELADIDDGDIIASS